MEPKAVQLTTKAYFEQPKVQDKFRQLLGEKAQGFVTSVLQVIASNKLLTSASPESIYKAAAVAAILDLPINQSLGFAYIVPYGREAQFQLGYKGLIQLAQRSGQFKTIAAAPVFEGQLREEDPLTGYKFDWKAKNSENIIGYAAYFSLINGFEKTSYMSLEQITAHGKRFSKTFGNGPWKSDFDAMATKTVLKLLLSKFAPLSIAMQKAVVADQGVVKSVNTDTLEVEVDYEDAGAAEITKEELMDMLAEKFETLSPEEVGNAERIIKNEEKTSYGKLKTLLQSK
jgi:recombination protein RecT